MMAFNCAQTILSTYNQSFLEELQTLRSATHLLSHMRDNNINFRYVYQKFSL